MDVFTRCMYGFAFPTHVVVSIAIVKNRHDSLGGSFFSLSTVLLINDALQCLCKFVKFDWRGITMILFVANQWLIFSLALNRFVQLVFPFQAHLWKKSATISCVILSYSMGLPLWVYTTLSGPPPHLSAPPPLPPLLSVFVLLSRFGCIIAIVVLYLCILVSMLLHKFNLSQTLNSSPNYVTECKIAASVCRVSVAPNCGTIGCVPNWNPDDRVQADFGILYGGQLLHHVVGAPVWLRCREDGNTGLV